MTLRNPLVHIGGVPTVLPSGDTIPFLGLAGGTLTGALTISYANPGANADLQVSNPSAAASTTARLIAVTGTSSAYTVVQQIDGAAPVGQVITGSGNTGGLSLVTSAGPVTLAPASGVVTVNGALQPSSALGIGYGGTGATTAAAARANLGVNVGSATLAFGGGAIVTAGTYPVDLPYAATLATLKYEVGSAGGSFTVGITVGGTAVTGLSGINVSSATAATATATGGNAVAAGGRVAFVVSNVSGSPTDAVLTLGFSKA